MTQPKAPFYMVGRLEGQTVILRAEKGKLKLSIDNGNQNQELSSIDKPLRTDDKLGQFTISELNRLLVAIETKQDAAVQTTAYPVYEITKLVTGIQHAIAQFHSELTGQEPGLVGYWNFNDGTANDLSQYRNNGFFIGNAITVPGNLPIMQIHTAVELVIPPGLPGGTYQVQYSTNVAAGGWANLGAPFQVPGGQTNFFDSTRGTAQRFYRLINP